MHFVVRFEPLPGKESELRDQLHRVVEPSRNEPGCVGFQVLESTRPPAAFMIHSEWVDEAAFDLHATLVHTVRFIASATPLLTHRVSGARLRAMDCTGEAAK